MGSDGFDPFLKILQELRAVSRINKLYIAMFFIVPDYNC